MEVPRINDSTLEEKERQEAIMRKERLEAMMRDGVNDLHPLLSDDILDMLQEERDVPLMRDLVNPWHQPLLALMQDSVKDLDPLLALMQDSVKDLDPLLDGFHAWHHLLHTDTCISRVDTLLKELKKNSNGSYSSENPLKVTVLGARGNFNVDSLLSKELASCIAKHNLVKVTYLVPEYSCSEREKRSAALNGVTIVEAKKQPGFDDPTDWLYFPPQDLKTDIVLGLGKVFGKIAQVFKALHRCKNIYIACTPLEEYQVLLEKKRISEEALIEHHRNFDKNFELCQTADLVVAPGPKMHEELSAPLRYDKKDVFKLTPGILSKFSDVKHATDEQANFRMLMFGSGDPDAFEQEGLNTALAAVTKLKNKSYHLLYVCAAEGKREQIANHICKFGVSKHQVIIRSSPESEEDLKRLLCEADLAIMPSSKQGFGMMALAALSSGLPVLVHEDSGFGKALKEVPFGTLSTLESEDANDWAEAIKRIRRKERKIRLEEAASLRSHYDAKYSWEEQCRDLLEKMLTMVTAQPDQSL